MILSDIYNSESLALYNSTAASNTIPFLGKAYFPDKKKMGIDLAWIKVHKGLNVALMPSNFDAIPTVRPRGNVQMTREQMPFFRESKIIKETDMIELSRIADVNDPFLQPIVDALYNDANDLIESAEIAAEVMRMSLLAPAEGAMGITIGLADNTKYTYNYDVGGTWKQTNFLESLTADSWDNATSKPLDDIQKGVQRLKSVGVMPTTIIGNSTTLGYLLNNDQIKSAIATTTGQNLSFVDTITVNEVLKRVLGLEFIAYDKMYLDDKGEEKKFYPNNYVTILGDGQLGNTWRGTTPEELTTLGNFIDAPQPPVDITVLGNGVAVAVMNEYKPALTISTTVSQIALPSFEGMDSIYVIKVKGE